VDFQYKAINAQSKSVSGQISATSEREAMRLLQQKNLTPLELVQAGQHAAVAGQPMRRAGHQEKAIVIRELAILLQAGVSLAEAVQSIGQTHTDSVIGVTFSQIYDRLRGGESFSQGLRAAVLDWPDFLYQLVAAGEKTGKLALALQSAATQMEYEQKVRTEIRNALIYPAILVFSGVAATLLIFILVVPKFANLLKNSRAQIPDISVWVLTMGLFVKENLLWVGLGTAGFTMAMVSIFANAALRSQALQSVSRMPLVGRWLVDTEIGRWAAMLGTLLENRVPILTAMELTHDGMHLIAVKQKLYQAMREVRGGKKLADALTDVQMLSVTGLNLIRVGERTGELSTMLRTLATIYENAGRERLKRFLILLEPIAILIIGSVIGTIMIAIMLAITSLSNIPT
jgi:general secretion pathway protein F